MKDKLKDIIGVMPKSDSSFTKRYRFHQGWYRAFVLGEDEGKNPVDTDTTVCNTYQLNPNNKHLNYLTKEAYEAVNSELNKESEVRLIKEPRVWNNLLSSQPLSFNFWGYLKYHLPIATQLLKSYISVLTEVVDIQFEWRPRGYMADLSAFDVIIMYKTSSNEHECLGLECKYTDRLISKKYDKDEYREFYSLNKDMFTMDYNYYIQANFNQLFRNQVMAMYSNNTHNLKIRCGIFCSKNDTSALDIANSYKSALLKSSDFLIITYEDFIEKVQQLDLDWDAREWTMRLWARYIALSLSDNIYN